MLQRWVYSAEALRGDASLEAAPAASFDEAEDRNQQCTCPDKDELQNFVEDGGTQAAEGDVNGDGARGDPDAKVDVPAENDFKDQGHGIHVDAAHEHGHEGEADGRKRAAGFSETQFQVAGHRVRFGNVIERHHDEREEEHGGNGADPIPVRGEDAVLIGGAGPAHQFEGAEIRGEETKAGDPGGHFATRHEEVFAGVRALLQIETNSENQDEVKDNDGQINPIEMHQTVVVHERK